jgi:TonB family protein
VDRLLPGPQLTGLTLDARAADFTGWVEDFEQRVHQNWIPPTYRGYGGRVDFGLLVERNGTVTAIEVLESTASEALERAAHEAFARSRLPPLPEDYDRLRVSLRVICVYGPPPGE